MVSDPSPATPMTSEPLMDTQASEKVEKLAWQAIADEHGPADYADKAKAGNWPIWRVAVASARAALTASSSEQARQEAPASLIDRITSIIQSDPDNRVMGHTVEAIAGLVSSASPVDVERVAKASAFARRSRHDQARDADHYWEHLGRATQEIEMNAAQAALSALPASPSIAAQIDKLESFAISDDEMHPEWHNGFAAACHAIRMILAASPSSDSEPDVVDSGMSGDAVTRAEWAWANLPTGRKWTSLATYEKALVCHTFARLTAIPDPEVMGEVKSVLEPFAKAADAMEEPGGGAFPVDSECSIFTGFDDDGKWVETKVAHYRRARALYDKLGGSNG
jgi:hypothetical protein